MPDNFNTIHRHSILYRSNQEMGKSKIKSTKQSLQMKNIENNNNQLSTIIDSPSSDVTYRNNYAQDSTPKFQNQLKLFHRFGGSIQNLPRPMAKSTKKLSASEFQLCDSNNIRNERVTVHEVSARDSWFNRWSWNRKSSPALSTPSKRRPKPPRSRVFQWRSLFPIFFFKTKSQGHNKV